MGLNRGRGTDKVPAHQLFRKTRGASQLVPEKFRRQLKTTVLTEDVPADYQFPTAFDTNEVFIDLKQKADQYEGAILTTIDEELVTSSPLRSYRYNKDRQIETLDESLVAEGATLPTQDALMTTLSEDALGDGRAILQVGTIDSVFGAQEYRRERPVVTPEVFRAQLQEFTQGLTSAGTAADPYPLAAGYISASDTQIDVFTHRQESRALPVQVLPISVIDSRTTREKQVETLTRTLEDDSTTPALPTALRDVTFTRLGDGTAVEEEAEVGTLFQRSKFIRERPSPFAREVRALRALAGEHDVTQLLIGNASDPTLGVGDISKTDEDINVFVHQLEHKYVETSGLPVEIVDKRTNRYRQVETVTNILELDTTTPAVPSATLEVNFSKLGDGTAVEEQISIPSVFSGIHYKRTRPLVTPEVFRALIEEFDFTQTAAGTAADPTPLPAGYVEASQEQVDVFTFRSNIRGLSLDALPIPVTGSRTNRYKQVETITRILEADTTTPATPTALLNVEFIKLGDGTAVEEQSAIPSVFGALSSAIEIADILPREFAAALPIYEHELNSAGTVVDPPVLSTGDLFKRERQLDVFTKSVSLRTRAGASFPADILDYETTEEYGGAVLNVARRVDNAPLTADTGYLVANSRVTTIGGGLYLRETKALNTGPWPILTEYDQDPETAALITTTYQVVDATTVSAPSFVVGQITRYKRIDQWRSLEIIEMWSLPAAYDEQRFMAHIFPSLWDFTLYNYSTACGATGPIRQGFSAMVQARLHISFTTTKSTITGLTLIPNTHHLVHDIVNAVLNDSGTITYVGTCSGPISLPASSPDFSTYTGSIQGTEQLISGESVKWKAGYYKNSELYITML